jgi:hypothetical protein
VWCGRCSWQMLNRKLDMLAEALVAVEVQDKMKAAAVHDPSLSMSASDILGPGISFQVRVV